MHKRQYIWFDCYIRTRNGRKPYYDYVQVERGLKDKELIWIHEGYGLMVLYRLWKVDDENFIAENTGKFMRKTSYEVSLANKDDKDI